MRSVIFISHATPEDNDFSIWLAYRLQLLNFEVWIDKNALLGGEKFWEEIDQKIRYQTIKFILVYSENICYKKQLGRLKDGIYKEYSLAETISKQSKLSDFIILLNIDGSTSNLFIGADRLNQIFFYENWAVGLKQLVKKLEKDGVKKTNNSFRAGLADWYENAYTTANGIIDAKKELYYTCWWKVPKLPEYFYLFQYESEHCADELFRRENPYPIGKIANNISTFDHEFSHSIKSDEGFREYSPKAIYEIRVQDVLKGYDSSEFPTHKDAEIHFKSLLSRVFHQIMKNRGMFWYQMANKKLAYFYTPANLKSLKVSFIYPFRKNRKKYKTKKLIGKYLSLGKWHFAISNKSILSPVVGFDLKTHLTFTTDGFDVWEDKNKIHKHRRSKGKNFFNEEWRDLLFAFLNGLKNQEGKIEIQLNDSFTLNMSPWTEKYWADFGYFEPKSKERLKILSEYDEIDFNEI